jgi:hypothetical protein
MSDSHYAVDLARRLAAAERYARLIETNRPNDHASIARAWAHYRRLKTLAVKH